MSHLHAGLVTGGSCIALALATLGCAGSQEPAEAPTAEASASGGEQAAEGQPDLQVVAHLAMLWALGSSGESYYDQVPEWFSHPDAGSCLPLGISGFVETRTQKYAPGDYSVTITNQENATWFTLYTYPAKRPLSEEFEEVLAVMRTTCQGAPAASTEYEDPRFGSGWIAGCSHEREGMMWAEEVVLLRDGDWFHKARATIPEPLLDAGHRVFTGVVNTAFEPCDRPDIEAEQVQAKLEH